MRPSDDIFRGLFLQEQFTILRRPGAEREEKGVKLVVSDAHEGLQAAIARVLGATWQR